MGFRSIRASRMRIVPSVAVWAIVAIACAGWATVTAHSEEDSKPKPKHLPATALRNRMLETYHGQATDLFTAIPGFGMERMPSFYKVVPFEVPEFSTGDVELEHDIAPPKVLEGVFEKSLGDFSDPTKSLPATTKKLTLPFGSALGLGLEGPSGATVVRGLQLRLLDLVGLTDPDNPRAYSGGKAFEVQRMTAEEAKAARAKNPSLPFGGMPIRPGKIGEKKDPTHGETPAKAATVKLETRPLDYFEVMGAAELAQGKNLFVRHKGNVVRMLGALRATEQCLKCHTDCKKGDLLGAFSYTFVDTNNALEKELKGTSAK